jgi:C4-dicarboxylate-specific signal transduction histidine kinase
MKFKIKQKITFIILIIILFFGLIASFIIYFKIKDTLFQKQYQNLFDNFENKSLLVDKDFFGTKKIISKVSNLIQIKEYLSQTSVNLQDESIFDILNSYNFNDNFSAIYILNKEGDTLVSTDKSFVGKNYSFRPYFKESKIDQVFVYAAKGVTSQKVGYYFSTSIKDNKNQQLGVLVFKLKPEIIHENFQEQKFEINLIDQNGVIIFSNQKEKILKSLGVVAKKNKVDININNTYSGMDIEELNYQSIQDKLPLINEVNNFDYFDNNNQQKIIFIKKTKEAPFYLMVENSISDVYSEANKIALTIAILVGSAALTAYFFIFFFLNKKLKPIEEIINASKNIIDGHLDQRVLIKTGDEFEILANNFNKVADNLIEKSSNIQQKIDEKTAELKNNNNYFIKRELKMIELKKKIKILERNEKTKK